MPARQPDASPESRAVHEVLEEDDDAVRAIALQAGPPPEANKLSERDLDTAWETMDPLVDDETMSTQLTTEGLPPETVQQLLVFKLNRADPERQQQWLKEMTKPTQDMERANMLIRAAKWPFRQVLMEDYDDPDEQVAEADRLQRRYVKRMTQLQEQVQQPGLVRTTSGYQGVEQE